MASVANLVNPTPFDVRIPYQQGVEIRIPADGEVNLTPRQMEDFIPGRPGSEEAKSLLDFEGVYLQDSDLSYEFQALDSLKAYVKQRKERIRNFVDRAQRARTQQGISVDEDVMNELKEQAGYGRMQKKIDKVVARIKILEKLVNQDEDRGSVARALDPERSCFVTNPPRQFPSKTALEMFLAENPEIKEKHDALTGVTEEADASTIAEAVQEVE